MKRFLLIVAVVVVSAARLSGGVTPLYENFGTVTNVPQINATAFANYGEFDVLTTLPYDTQNTLYYTNRGILSGTPGFRFDYVDDAGTRRPAVNFVNSSGGTVFAGSGPGLGALLLNQLVTVFPDLENPAIFISATNVASQGLLDSATAGIISVSGNHVDLNRGGIEIEPLSQTYAGFCFFGGSPTVLPNIGIYFPDPGIYDLYWGMTNQFMNVANNLGLQITDPVNGLVNITAPRHQVISPSGGFNCYFTNFTGFSLANASSYLLTNAFTPTNWMVEAVFVANTDFLVGNDVRFYPSTSPTNPYSTFIVELAAAETNVVTGGNLINTLYLIDTLASETNYLFLTNVAGAGGFFGSCPTMMPGNFVLSRGTPCEFLLGTGPNTYLTTNTLFYDQTFSNRFVTNFYSAYAAVVTNYFQAIPAVPGASYQDLPGRVEITSGDLNLNRTRIRAESTITIQTDNLIGSTNAAVDAENLRFDLASKQGTLRVQNLAKTTVQRFAGTVSAWSAVFTNDTGMLVTNMVENPPGSGMFTNQVDTNVIEIGYHILLVDGHMIVPQQVVVHDLIMHSTNVVVADNMNVGDTFLLDADTFLLTGSLTVGPTAFNWNSEDVPHLRYFTNTAFLSIANSGNFGADRVAPYENFVNSGEIDAFDLQIRSKNLDNGGTLVSSADVTIDTTQGKVDGGSIFAGGGISVSGTGIKFRNSTLNPAQKLTFSVTDTLQDSGLDGPNTWTPGDGLAITVKPKVSDLFGTTVVLSTPRFANVINVSAADDLGPTVAGYSNNLAIGHLSLETGIDGLLTFTGTGVNNALYVDFLEVGPSVLADLEGTLEIAPNLVIYFADANVSVDQLDGQLGGHLVWAKDFAGPNSSVDVLLLNGQTVKMNSALRASTTIDTDGDGVANAFDLYPLDAAAWNSSQGPSGNAKVTLTNSGSSQSVAVSWKALPSDNYRVEYTPSLSPPNWQPLTGYTNLVVTNGAINVLDADLPIGQSQRFYRLRPAGGSGGNGP